MPTDLFPATPPDDPVLADRAGAWRGAYVHIPFCRRVCPYCDFAVVAQGGRDLRDRYVAAVVAEIEAAEPWGPLDAIHVGGGTPSRVPASRLGAIIEALGGRFGVAPGAEVALEANPEDWTPGYAEAVAAAGFDRVSLGVQSFDPGVLASLGRRHTPHQGAGAVAAARSAGFRSVSVDLIFGTPGETMEAWRGGVARALETGIDHLSVYALTVELGTELSRAVRAGAPAPDPDDQAAKYESAVEMAAAAGMARYETSNLARAGHASRYNLLTWAQGDFVGFGNGAHSHRAGIRSWNVRRVDRYLERISTGDPAESGRETLGGRERERERVVLGLRRACGVVAGEAGRALLGSGAGRRLVTAGVLEARPDRLVVTRPLLGDEVARALLALDGGEC